MVKKTEKTSRKKVYLCEDLFDIDSLRTEYVSLCGSGCVGERESEVWKVRR